MFDTMKKKPFGAGVALALVGSTLGGVAMVGLPSAAAQTPPNTPAVTQQAAPGTSQTPQAEPTDTAEAPECANAPETADANEPQLPGGGHADPAGVDVQHDFQGVE